MEKEFEIHDSKKWERRRERTKRYYKRWEERRKHKFRYAVIHGSLVWGGVMFILITGDEMYESKVFILPEIIFRLCIYLIGGFLVGLISFKNAEMKYQKYINTKEED
jgi:hypothetical protein